ncbi:LysR family transcriptional regulator [Nocardia yamanashiensis]|uniref:LysR substrate-binding domain-containing protein n=1 Tax=Nocardia yamanashiensis TaxID=209247 RepID=UPI000836C5A8|nr:LysR family transcriptional regulator [Nocardia yamanashiensis]
MELRDIEIFLTLAEELHFGRTAERLNVTPARITQAIKKQERQIGALLFERTNRVVRLTAVGEQLRADLRPLYRGLEQSVRRAKLAARGQTTVLRVALHPFNFEGLHKYWAEFRRRHPQWELRLHRLAFTDPFNTLRNGQYDALVTWGPVDDDLTMGPVLFRDSRVLAVSHDHPLADRSEVSVEDFADYLHAMPPKAPPGWEGTYLPFFTPSGRPITRGRQITNPDDLIDWVGNGDIVHAFPAHVLHHWAVTHVRWIPVTDMPPLPYALVWRTESEPVRALATVISDLSDAP